MLLYPAIDLMGGEVVRLRRGLAAEKTVYSRDPAEIARKWEGGGAGALHIVDLDAAFSGQSGNLSHVEKICRAVSVPCQLGGGIRDIAAARAAFDAGVSRVILGTRAAESLETVREMCAEFGADRVAVGIDARDGCVAVKGWTQTTALPASELALSAQAAGVGTIIYTDIATDGMLEGPNVAAIRDLLAVLECRLIASGGVSCLDDLERLAALARLHGAIIGKALYDGRISLPLPQFPSVE